MTRTIDDLTRQYDVEPRRLSVSQVSTYVDCPRKWAIRYIDGVKTPPNKFAAIGSAFHEVAEAYLTDGTLPEEQAVLATAGHEEWTGGDLTRMLMPGLKYWPEPGVAKCEEKIWADTVVGPWVGFIDVGYDHVIGDHKSTSGFQWALTGEELLTNPQTLLYAYAKDLPVVQARWVYYLRTKHKPAARLAKADMPRSLVEENIKVLFQQGLDVQEAWMRSQAEGLNGIDFQYDTQTCGKYGGCPYRGQHCQLTNKEKLQGVAKKMGLRDELLARKRKAKERAEPKAEPKTAPKARPKKEAAPPQPVVEETEDQINPPEKPTERTPETEQPGAPEFGWCGPLYINCVPVKGVVPITHAGDLLSQAKAAIAEDNGGTDYRLIPDLYGGAPALLEAAMLEQLDAVNGAIVLFLGGEANQILQLLVSRASYVVRGC